MVLDLISWDYLYPEYTREMATYRKQIRIPPPRGPSGLEVRGEIQQKLQSTNNLETVIVRTKYVF